MNLTWKEIDLKRGFIRLGRDLTKNKVGRNIPLHPRLSNTYKVLLGRLLWGLFLVRRGGIIRKAYNKAVEAAGILDFNFHDLRHCAINNIRLAGNDHFVINQASGAKTDSVFQRYNLVTEEEMKSIKWLDVQDEKSGKMDTYVNTTAKTEIL